MTQKELENAVLFKKIEKIRKAREQGIDVNQLGSAGNSLLHTAMLDGKEEAIIPVLDELLKFPNIDIDRKNSSFSYSPLMSALFAKKYILADYLIKNKADVNIEDSMGNTPLMTAIENKEKDKIDFLLKYNPDLNHENKNGATPVFLAAAKNIVVSELIEMKADIAHVSKNGNCIAYGLSLNPSQETTVLIANEMDRLGKIKDLIFQIDNISAMYQSQSLAYPNKSLSKGVANLQYVKTVVSSIDLYHKLNEDIQGRKNTSIKKKKI